MRRKEIDLIFSLVALLIFIAIIANIKYIGTKDFSYNFKSFIFGVFGLIIGLGIAIIVIVLLIRYIFKSKSVLNEDKKYKIKKDNSGSFTSRPSNKSNSLIENKSFETRISPESIGEFLEKLRSIDWYQFEQITGVIYKSLGYKVTRPAGYKPDGGIDMIIEKDTQQWALQCKHWKTRNVGVKPIREFLGALQDSGIKNGIFITLCGFTNEAKQFAERNGIEILNETGLLKLIEQTNTRFNPEVITFLNDERKFCPKCGNEMVLRVAKKGILSGKKFWGCTAYPVCHYRINVED
ncbi:MAG: restriction endonuclease [Verrucomicrobiia bacterium]